MVEKSAQLFGEVVLVPSDQFEQDVFLGGKVEIKGAAGNSRGFDDRVDICRVRSGALELYDGGIEHPRTRFPSLCFATRRSVWHSPILQYQSDSLTYVTRNRLPRLS